MQSLILIVDIYFCDLFIFFEDWESELWCALQGSVECKNVMKENEDDLSMFFEMRNRELGTNDLSLLQNSDDFDDSFGMIQVLYIIYTKFERRVWFFICPVIIFHYCWLMLNT